MNDLERERDFYRQQCNDLGIRLLKAQQEQSQARQEARSSRITAMLIREIYRLVDARVSLAELGQRFLRIIEDTLQVDRVALLKYQPESGCFIAEHLLGFPQAEPLRFTPPQLPDEFYFVNSTGPAGPLSDCLRQAVGTPYLAWTFDVQSGLALLVGNLIEDQHLHRPFEIGFTEILAGSLAVFVEIDLRQRTEAALSSSEERFRQVVSSITDHLYMTELTLKGEPVNLYLSPNVTELTGYPLERFQSDWSFWPSLIHPDDRAAAAAQFAQFMAGRNSEAEYRLTRADGQVIWVRDSGRVEKSPDGQGLVIYGVVSHITERRKTEEALRESEAANRAILEAIPDLMVRLHRDGTYLDAKSGEEVVTVLPPEEMIGKKMAEVLPPVVAEQLMAGVTQALQTGETQTVEYQVDIGDHVVYREARLAPIATDEVLILMRDITERKRAEEDLTKFKLGIEHSNDAFFLTDTNGVITYVNSAFETIYGFSRDEALGKTPRILKSGLIPQASYQHFWGTLLSGGSVSGEIVNKAKDGRLVHVAGSNNPILNEAGNIVGFLAVHRDITAQKQAEAERERLLSEVQRLAGIVKNHPDFIGIGSLDGETFYVNPAGLKLVGLPPDYDFTRLDFKELIPSSKIDQFLQEARTAPPSAVGSRSWAGEGYLLRADGSQLLVERTIVVNYDADHKPVSLSVTMRDITERQQAQETLTYEQQLLQALMDNSPDYLFFKDRQSRFIRTNRAHAVDLLNLASAEEAVGLTDFDLFPAADAQRFYDEEQQIMATQKPVLAREWSMPSPTLAGETAWVSEHKIPLVDKSGEVFGLLGIARDITERKRIEETVAKRADELETVAQVSAATATILDTDRLLQEVVDLTRERFDLYHAHIYLLKDPSPTPPFDGEGEGGVLELAAGAGEVGRRMAAEGWHIPLKREQSLVARAARTRQGVIVNDVQLEPGFLPNPWLPETRSELAVPMIAADQLVGVLDVQADTVNRFTVEDVRIQTTLAAQITVALENARLLQQTEAALAEMQQSQELLRSVIDATPDWILVKDRQHRFRLVNQGFANSIHRTPAEIVGKNDLDLGVPEEIVKGNPEKGIRGFWADDLDVMDSDRMKTIESEPTVIDGKPAFLNTIKVPMRDAQGEVWGVLAYVRNITTLKQAEASMAKRAAELSCLNDLGREMESAPLAAELLEWVTGRVPPVMQYPELCRMAIEYGGHVYGAAEAMDLPTQMTHGLYLGGEIMGRVYIAYIDKRDFLNEESALLGGIANRLSGYLENRRLFEQAQSQARREELLRQVSDRIRGSVDVETIMRTAAQEVGQALGRPAFVYLGNGGNGEQSSTGPGEKEA